MERKTLSEVRSIAEILPNPLRFDPMSRRERLERRLREMELLQRGGQAAPVVTAAVPSLDAEDVDGRVLLDSAG